MNTDARAAENGKHRQLVGEWDMKMNVLCIADKISYPAFKDLWLCVCSSWLHIKAFASNLELSRAIILFQCLRISIAEARGNLPTSYKTTVPWSWGSDSKGLFDHHFVRFSRLVYTVLLLSSAAASTCLLWRRCICQVVLHLRPLINTPNFTSLQTNGLHKNVIQIAHHHGLGDIKRLALR